MSIRQRNGVWYADIAHQNGQRIRRSLQTNDRIAAQEYHDKIVHELWRTSNLGDRVVRTWDDAAARWLVEMAHKASIAEDAKLIRALKKLRGLVLAHITRDVALDAVKEFGPSNSTKNRYLALIRSILRKCAREWDWLEAAPTIKLYPEPRKRIRWLKQAEAKRLILALPPHCADMCQLTLATGLRKRNILELTWAQIDLVRRVAWVHPDQAKARRAIGVPLNETAIDVLVRQLGKHPERVFTFKGKPVHTISSTTWKDALERADIKNFRWHDLRHTWASWHIQSGTPLPVLQELGGWESASMVQRYAHLAPEHMAQHASAIDMIMGHGTNTAHEETEEISVPEKLAVSA